MEQPTKPNFDHIDEVITSRLCECPSEIRDFLPEIVTHSSGRFILSTDKYLLVTLYDDPEINRIQELRQKGYPPFPGLIAKDEATPAAFALSSSKWIFLKDCSIADSYALRLGPDTTVVLDHLSHSINVQELGRYEYVIQLAYILSYGNEIAKDNVHEFLEELVIYSINRWRSENDKRTSP
jgi:hypothetical protein